jgi:hypothetical protein
VGRVAVVVGGAKSEAYLRTKYPPRHGRDGKNLKRLAFIQWLALSFLVLIPGQIVKADSKPYIIA